MKSNNTSNAQESLNKLALYLAKYGLNEEQILEFLSNVSNLIVQMTINTIIETMDDDQIKNWNKFVDSGANETQQLVLLDKILQKTENKTLEELQDETTTIITKNMQTQLEEIRNMAEDITKLNQNQLQKALNDFKN